jgi:hypothetical protein
MADPVSYLDTQQIVRDRSTRGMIEASSLTQTAQSCRFELRLERDREQARNREGVEKDQLVTDLEVVSGRF